MKKLLEMGVNPNVRSEAGASALLIASEYGFVEALQLLLRFRADVYLKDWAGMGVIAHAVKGDNVHILRELSSLTNDKLLWTTTISTLRVEMPSRSVVYTNCNVFHLAARLGQFEAP
jgi:hypothetical protein